MNFMDTLRNLEKWKNLPAYRAEPRVDFIVAGALPEIVKSRWGCNPKIVIPELPLRIGSLDLEQAADPRFQEKSFKVDFYVLLEDGRNIFFEFKTDMGSIRDEQIEYLVAARNSGMNEIVEGIIALHGVTSQKYKPKYKYLLEQLKAFGVTEVFPNAFRVESIVKPELEVAFILPRPLRIGHGFIEIGFEEVAALMAQSTDSIYIEFSEVLRKWSKQ